NVVMNIIYVPTNIWVGTQKLWDTNTENWRSSALYREENGTGYAVLFDDSMTTTNTNVVVQAIVSPNSFAVSNQLKSYTIGGTGEISGYGNLTKKGTGTLTLNVSISTRGDTLVRAGTLVLLSTNSGGGTAIVDAGAILAGSGSNAGQIGR